MADIVNASPSVMRDKANTLKNVATSIRTLTDEMKNEINRMKAFWDGTAAEKFTAKFNGLNDDFQERYDMINKYAQFLLNAADEFERLEKETVNQGESLLS